MGDGRVDRLHLAQPVIGEAEHEKRSADRSLARTGAVVARRAPRRSARWSRTALFSPTAPRSRGRRSSRAGPGRRTCPGHRRSAWFRYDPAGIRRPRRPERRSPPPRAIGRQQVRVDDHPVQTGVETRRNGEAFPRPGPTAATTTAGRAVPSPNRTSTRPLFVMLVTRGRVQPHPPVLVQRGDVVGPPRDIRASGCGSTSTTATSWPTVRAAAANSRKGSHRPRP